MLDFADVHYTYLQTAELYAAILVKIGFVQPFNTRVIQFPFMYVIDVSLLSYIAVHWKLDLFCSKFGLALRGSAQSEKVVT